VVNQLLPTDALASRLRAGAEWANERRDLVRAVRALRQVLPGDPDFGDPLSTGGSEPAQLVGRRLWTFNRARFSAAGETGLAFLQVAEWVARREQSREEPRDLAIVFTDLVAFSSWALEAGDDRSLELLRQVGVVVEGCVEDHGGRIIKRLGDGVMAVFDEPADALAAVHEAIEGVEGIEVGGYRPRLRAGLHMGRARQLGGDYLGVDVNVASRICEDAHEGEALVSRPALDGLDGTPVEIGERRTVSRPGVPDDLEVYVAVLDGSAGVSD
jgi:adenylate cyclase